MWGEVSQNHIFKVSFYLFLECIFLVADFNSLCNRPQLLWYTPGEIAKKTILECAKWHIGWLSTFVFLGGWASGCLKYGLNFSGLSLICKNLFNRGDQASFKAELDWILSAQILFAVWNQQSEIGRSHSIPIQLSRQVVFTWFLWKGDFCTDFVGNCYWSFVGDHGGMWFKTKEIIHKRKWHCLQFLQASSVVRCTSHDVVIIS